MKKTTKIHITIALLLLPTTTLAKSFTYNLTYDGANRVTNVKVDEHNTADYKYRPNGQLEQVTLTGNGQSEAPLQIERRKLRYFVSASKAHLTATPDAKSSSDGNNHISYSTGVVTIDHAQSTSTIQFSPSNYSVAENEDSITITVTRTNSSAGAVSVDYATSDAADKPITINIINDSEQEEDKTLILSLGNVTGGATLGVPDTTILTIKDNNPNEHLNNNTWVKLHNLSITGDLDDNGQDEIIIDFGTDVGTWQWTNNSTWEQLHNLSPESMVTGNIDGKSEALGVRR